MIQNLNNNDKKQLFDNGYLVFEASDDFKKELLSFKNELDYKSLLYKKYTRAVAGELCINGMKASGDLRELKKLRQSVMKAGHDISQMWYIVADDEKLYQSSCLVYMNKELQKTVDFFYQNVKFPGLGGSNYLMYDRGCRFGFHKDGGYVNVDGVKEANSICTILIYMDEASQNSGGEIVIKTNEDELITVPTTLGTCVILDLTKNDLWHRVNEVKTDKYFRENLRFTLSDEQRG